MYRPTTSRTLSMNCGSVDSFQVSTKCGLSPNARQIREIDDCDRPVALAMPRVDQCVSPLAGVCSSVFTMTSSTWSSLITREAPGRGSSVKPCKRFREPPPPPSDGLLPSPQRHRHILVGRSLRARQHDPRPKSQCLGRFRASRPPLQRVTLGLGQHQLSLRPPRPRAIGQSVEPRLNEAPTPFTHRRRRHSQIRGDLLTHRPGHRARQHNPRPIRQPGIPSRPPNKQVTLLDRQSQLSLRPPSPRHSQTVTTTYGAKQRLSTLGMQQSAGCDASRTIPVPDPAGRHRHRTVLGRVVREGVKKVAAEQARCLADRLDRRCGSV